jgi:hypothetical protein
MKTASEKTKGKALDRTILYGRMILLTGRQGSKISKQNKVLGLDKPISIV